MVVATLCKENTEESKRKLYNADLALKGVSALIASINVAMREGDARPTDDMISDALYAIEVQIDQIASDIERQDEEEIMRLRKISQHTGIPMSQLYEMGFEAEQQTEQEWDEQAYMEAFGDNVVVMSKKKGDC